MTSHKPPVPRPANFPQGDLWAASPYVWFKFWIGRELGRATIQQTFLVVINFKARLVDVPKPCDKLLACCFVRIMQQGTAVQSSELTSPRSADRRLVLSYRNSSP